MEIKTRVLTNPQHLEPSRRETARKNIAAIGKIKVSPNTRLAPPEGSDELDLSEHSVPTPDASGKILKSSADGKYSWETPYGIEQVPADWGQVDETKPDFVKNKPTLDSSMSAHEDNGITYWGVKNPLPGTIGNSDDVLTVKNGAPAWESRAKLPDAPINDGKYVLTCTVNNGTAVYAWDNI